VGQSGPSEVLLEHRIHRPGVTDDEAGQQARWPAVQDARSRVAQPFPDGAGRPVQQVRLADDRGWAAGGDDRDHVVALLGQRETHPDADRLPRDHAPPLLGRSEQQHVGAQVVRGRPVHEQDCGRVRHHARGAGAAQRVRGAVQLEDHRRRPFGLRCRAQRRALPRRSPDRRRRRRDRDTGQERQQEGCRRPPVSAEEQGEAAGGEGGPAQQGG
jgi:hypothetical protein